MADSWRSRLERLFAGQQRRLYGYFYRRIRDPSQVPDLVQEVFFRMLRVPDPDALKNPEVYLYTVARNLLAEYAVLEQRRSATLDMNDVELPPNDAPEPGDLMDDDFWIAEVRRAIELLSPKCRAVVLMQYQHGLSYREIADRLEISTNMVKKYHSRAIVEIRQRLGSDQ